MFQFSQKYAKNCNADSVSCHCKNTAITQGLLKFVDIDTHFSIDSCYKWLTITLSVFCFLKLCPFSKINFQLLIAAITVVCYKILKLKAEIIFDFFQGPSGIDRIQKGQLILFSHFEHLSMEIPTNFFSMTFIVHNDLFFCAVFHFKKDIWGW